MSDDGRLYWHYQMFSEAGRLQKSRVRRLEFDTTVTVLEKHIEAGSSILELGVGHGSYSFNFARAGQQVLATDVLAHHVDAMRDQLEPEDLRNVRTLTVDAARLDPVPDGPFDVILCLGPFYHLRTRESRRRCLLECRRVARESGLIAVLYINRPFAVGHLLRMGRTLTAEQYDAPSSPDDYPDDFWNVSHFCTPSEVEEEVQACGLRIVEHVGTDGVFGFVEDELEAVDERTFQEYRAHHLSDCVRRSSSPGSSFHCLLVTRVPTSDTDSP